MAKNNYVPGRWYGYTTYDVEDQASTWFSYGAEEDRDIAVSAMDESDRDPWIAAMLAILEDGYGCYN